MPLAATRCSPARMVAASRVMGRSRSWPRGPGSFLPADRAPGAPAAARAAHPVAVAPAGDPDGAAEPPQAEVGHVDARARLAARAGDHDRARPARTGGVQRGLAIAGLAGPD